jgi:4-hydroxy-tetrahydrodipicolinate synthase
MTLRGVHTALVTPFIPEGVDLETFRTLCERQLAAGVHGLVPCGTTGETPTLSRQEWGDLIRVAVEVSEGRVPVTAGCGTNATSTTVKNIREAQALGADAALVVLPYYNKPNPGGHIAHLQQACSVGLPVVAYHVPGRTGQQLPAEQLAELANLDGVIAVKEATGDVHFGSELIRRTSAAVLSGDDFTFYPLLCVGSTGVVSVVSNVDPRRTVALYDAAVSGNLETALGLHQGLMDLVAYLFAETNPVPCKAVMAAMGLCENRVRLPLVHGAPPPPEILAGVLS